jgi:exosortase/archaeosortase family protein
MEKNKTALHGVFATLPPGLFKFLVKGVGLFILWRWVYEGYLKPIGTPDHQLIQFLLACTYKIMLPLYPDALIKGYTIYVHQQPVLTFAIGCNGLELMVLYLGFLFCYSTSVRRVLYYSVVGLVLINVLNILRCVGLAIWYIHHLPYWDFMHHYVFKLVIYAVNFLLWVSYTKKNEAKPR